MSSNTVIEGSLQNPMPGRILLIGNEKVKVTSTAQMLSGDDFRMGQLVVTDLRLVFVQSTDGRTLLDRGLHDIVGVEESRNVLVGSNIRSVVVITYPGKSYILDFLQTNPPNLSAEAIANVIVSLRKNRTTGASRDFGWLKDFLDRGGIMVTAVKCPSCGAPIQIPKEGSYARCNHCGQNFYVEDIYKIIQGLTPQAIASPSTASPESHQQNTPIAKAPPVVHIETHTCRHCGKNVQTYAKYCNYCGQYLVGPS